ncbi:hypothetical protein PR048_013751 [Dryococelus australis]|uniref:Uncharacterized protein n=1 Tax=Dryococelus australis TaxID=614101 RepID=A0ABQ9HT14_9NEOP|nr:hypothetical protein PR048_013751 [Dryococelus australis]
MSGLGNNGDAEWTLPVVRPYFIEIPRSLVQVVVYWNMPMHNWLKTWSDQELMAILKVDSRQCRSVNVGGSVPCSGQSPWIGVHTHTPHDGQIEDHDTTQNIVSWQVHSGPIVVTGSETTLLNRDVRASLHNCRTGSGPRTLLNRSWVVNSVTIGGKGSWAAISQGAPQPFACCWPAARAQLCNFPLSTFLHTRLSPVVCGLSTWYTLFQLSIKTPVVPIWSQHYM